MQTGRHFPQSTTIDCRFGISSSPSPIAALSAVRVLKVWVLSGASELGVGVRYAITFCGMGFEHKL